MASAVLTSARKDHIDLSVIIVNWNAAKYLEGCLGSLFEALPAALVSEVILVDNGSTDGSVALVAARYPNVRIVNHGANVGFAAGNNIGLSLARGSYLCLANPDVVLSPRSLLTMYSYMNAHPEVGLLGPKMLDGEGLVQRSAMAEPSSMNTIVHALGLDTLLPRSFLGHSLLMREFSFDTTRDVDVLNGYFWMIRSSVLAAVGPLDERFFMYGEDLDFCLRVRVAGWAVRFLAETHVVHFGGGSSRWSPTRFYLEMQRSNNQYWKKHHGYVGSIIYLSATLVHHLLRFVTYSVKSVVMCDRSGMTRHKRARNGATLLWVLSRTTERMAGLCVKRPGVCFGRKSEGSEKR
jgi:GT2 family glycosyltransferase